LLSIVFAQFRTRNRFPLSLELLYAFVFTALSDAEAITLRLEML
jgi:hypothetical protein